MPLSRRDVLKLAAAAPAAVGLGATVAALTAPVLEMPGLPKVRTLKLCFCLLIESGMTLLLTVLPPWSLIVLTPGVRVSV